MSDNGRAVVNPDGLKAIPDEARGVPYSLVIVRETGASVSIDVEEHGWLTTYAEWLRGRSRWHLVRKADQMMVLVMEVFEGEQPYYTARHIGAVGGGGSNEIVAYSIGKKRLDGHVDRLWVLPNGVVCGGDDVNTLGRQYLETVGPRR